MYPREYQQNTYNAMQIGFSLLKQIKTVMTLNQKRTKYFLKIKRHGTEILYKQFIKLHDLLYS